MSMEVNTSVGSCPRCHKYLMAEDYDTHKCDFESLPILGCNEIVLDHLTDSGEDENGDQVHLAWALDGMLYRLLVCEHNPPHSAKRRFTGENTNQGLDKAVATVTRNGWQVRNVLVAWKRFGKGDENFSLNLYCTTGLMPSVSGAFLMKL
jgi:hypothetical protein